MLSMINNILLLCFISLCLGFADAGPIRARQDCAEPITVTTVHSTLTAAGPMIETCVITLTPIKNERGEDAVLEVRRCRLEPDINNGSGAPPPPATTDVVVTQSSTFATESSSSSVTLATEVSLSSSSVATITSALTDSVSATITSGTVAATATNGGEAGSGAISVNGFTTVTDFTSSASATTLPASSVTFSSAPTSPTDAAGGVVVNGPVSSIASSAIPTPATTDVVGGVNPAATDTLATSAADTTSSVSAAAAEASGSATAAFALPGKKISVLPIGLGVFAGISVIALIVVGLVTYERTKYRKTFRQQKLAETGASMGYGGMAQRI